MKHEFKLGDKVILTRHGDLVGEVIGFYGHDVAVLNDRSSAGVVEYWCKMAGICKKHLGKTFWLQPSNSLRKQ